MRHDPMDLNYARSVLVDVLDPILAHYFRPRVLGCEKIPHDGPLIVAANHSGNAFPYDAIVLDAMLWKRGGLTAEAKFRSTFEKELALTWWMNPFGLDNFWRRCGGVDITFDNLDRLLARKDRIIYYPEGVPGIGKGFQNRYRLQPFRTSFVLLAVRHGAPVFPTYVINGEWIIPFNFMWRPVDRLFSRVFHVPFLPLPGAFLAIAWPWVWYLTMPAQLIFKVGDPVDLAAWLREEGADDPARADPETAARVAERLRRTMQAELDRLVARFGRSPYHARSLRREWTRARGRRSKVVPWGWPVSWVRHDRDRRRTPARNRLHAILRDWDLAGFYLPFGWPLLSLARALRKPPCGYRGLTLDDARVQRGNFVWRIGEAAPPSRDEPDEASLEHDLEREPVHTA